MDDRLRKKLEILADAAKYDVSCASSGSRRDAPSGGLGHTTGMGICHAYTEDGRCVSLLKLLLTNHCIFDCAFCISRRSSDVERAAFTVDEVVDLTVQFYRRNYIEGLFLSSGIFKNADYTTERLVQVAKRLRTEHRFGGYIHLKVIPDASPELIEEAGRWADRLSLNLEIPTEPELKKVAPEKDHASVLRPMAVVRERIAEAKHESKRSRHAPRFAPGGQSTQVVVGATPERDRTILTVAQGLYREQSLKRVYYSAYVPVGDHTRLADVAAPVRREHRLYQADWLLRYYGFETDELLPEDAPDLDPALDPKTLWALRNPELFPVDVNRAPIEMLLRVPGLGVRSAQRIVAARRHGQLRFEDLARIGVVMKRARYFVTAQRYHDRLLERRPDVLRARLSAPTPHAQQGSLFDAPPAPPARASAPATPPEPRILPAAA